MAGSAPLEFANYPTVSIATLNEVAALQDRKDRKYLVPVDELPALLDGAVEHIHVLDIDGSRAFRYETVYFDTPDFLTYRLAARSRPRRFKVRSRSYVDSSATFLEVKERTMRGRTIKHRFDYSFSGRDELSADGRDFVREFSFAAPVADVLEPALTTTYERVTLYLPEAQSRVTIDLNLWGQAASGGGVGLRDVAVVETKSVEKATSIDKLLWRGGHRPLRVSKYGTSLAAIRPELPSNKWHRTMRHFFAEPIAAAG